MAEWEAPTVEQVALHLPTRTRDRNGGIVRTPAPTEDGDPVEGVRTFSDVTVPTRDEVVFAIGESVSFIQSDVGAEFCDLEEAASFPEKATRLTALYTAMVLELGYYPEQVQKGQSPYTELKKLYDQRREFLRSEVEEVCGDVPGDDVAGDGGGWGKPDYDFEAPTTSLGRGTVW